MGKGQLMLVRPIRVADVDAVMILLEYYRNDTNIDDEDWDTDSLLKTVKQFVISQDYIFLVAVEGQRIVGCLAGALKKEFYNNNIDAVIQLVFLLQSHRNQENYKQLYDQFEQYGQKFNARRVLLIDPFDTQTRIEPIADILGFQGRNLKVFAKEIE